MIRIQAKQWQENAVRLNGVKASLLARLGDPLQFEERERKLRRVRDQDASTVAKTLSQIRHLAQSVGKAESQSSVVKAESSKNGAKSSGSGSGTKSGGGSKSSH